MNKLILKDLFTVDNPQKIISNEIAHNDSMLKEGRGIYWAHNIIYGDSLLISLPENGVIENRYQSMTVKQDDIFTVNSAYPFNQPPEFEAALYHHHHGFNQTVMMSHGEYVRLLFTFKCSDIKVNLSHLSKLNQMMDKNITNLLELV